MWQSLITTLAYRYFKDDLMELQRYRNTTHSINRWCASNPVADAVTEEILLVSKDEKSHDPSSFRNSLKDLCSPEVKRLRKLITVEANYCYLWEQDSRSKGDEARAQRHKERGDRLMKALEVN